MDRRGTVEALPLPARQYQAVALSPDRRRAAVDINADRDELWVYDFERRTMTRLLTGDGSGQAPVWSPDGRHVAYRATRAGSRNAFWIDVGGGSSEERLTTNPDTETPGSFTPDGRWLLTSRTSQGTASDVWASPTQEGEPRRLIGAEGDQRAPQVSADGRWLAYSSEESGRSEVYVQPFPSLDAKWLISGDGGIEPRWSPDGRELFYRSGDRLMAVAVATGGAFSAGRPQPLFSGHGFPAPTNSTGYDVSADGQRFLMAEPVEPERPITTIELVLNWFQELNRLAPVP